MSWHHTRPILVLGAGIQGISTALALQHRGYRVTLIDRMPDLVLRTSLRNEGKIHLGYVYANDPTFRTSELLLRAALSFGPLMEEWLGAVPDWNAIRSSPFDYLVMRDSMLSPNALHAHYDRMQVCLNELVSQGERASYLGRDLRSVALWRPSVADTSNWFSPDQVAECIETVEVAVDRQLFRDVLKTHLCSMPAVEMRFGHDVKEIERSSGGLTVSGMREDGGLWSEAADIVINCLWDGRLTLDRQMGIDPKRAFVMRLKYRILGDLPPALNNLPSMTLVLGRYGDIVRYPNSPTYFSWYPTCLRGWSSTITPPAEWDAVCSGNPPADITESVRSETLAAFDQIIPGLGSSLVHTVDGGIIYSWGATDIDDHASELHTRHEIGFEYADGYYTVDTGKFTCAPLFADRIARHIAC